MKEESVRNLFPISEIWYSNMPAFQRRLPCHSIEPKQGTQETQGPEKLGQHLLPNSWQTLQQSLNVWSPCQFCQPQTRVEKLGHGPSVLPLASGATYFLKEIMRKDDEKLEWLFCTRGLRASKQNVWSLGKVVLFCSLLESMRYFDGIFDLVMLPCI